MTTRENIVEQRQNLFNAVNEAISNFQKETGVGVSGLTVRLQDVTTNGSSVKEFIVTEISVTLCA